MINVKRVKKIDEQGNITFDIKREITQIVELTGYDSVHGKWVFKPVLGDIDN